MSSISGTDQSGMIKTRGRKKKLGQVPWWFILPGLAIYLLIVVWPSINGAAYAFTNWNGLSTHFDWVGLKNFIKIPTDSAAISSIKHTLLIAFTTTTLSNSIGLLLAVFVASKLKVSNLAKVLFFLPNILTPLVTAFMWGFVLAPKGALNILLESIGLASLKHVWLGDPKSAMVWLIIVIIWQMIGSAMVIFLSGLEGISGEVLEAAEVDGANAWEVFWFIKLPLLAPAASISIVLSVIFSLKIFDQVMALTYGGPGYATETLSTLMYKNAFQSSKFGYAAALALILSVFVAAISIPLYGRMAWKDVK